jgi:heme/copper-type cytochrome/quinol oxidase subunit 2
MMNKKENKVEVLLWFLFVYTLLISFLTDTVDDVFMFFVVKANKSRYELSRTSQKVNYGKALDVHD